MGEWAGVGASVRGKMGEKGGGREREKFDIKCVYR
jgi:hypothetical protein